MVVVAAAIVCSDGCVLLQQRAPGRAMAGLWEFPGGKVEAGERVEEALVRELEEELGIVARHDDFVPVAFASAAVGERPMLLLLFLLRRWSGEPQALDAAALRWVDVAEMRTLPMPPADEPLLPALEAALSGAAPSR
jgi:8-oxo-dGTP diphosphatase